MTKNFKGIIFHQLLDDTPIAKELVVRRIGTVKYADNTIARSLAYEAATKSGDCGLPVFIADSHTRCEKIAGFHVAARGDHRLGFGNVITQEHLSKFCDSLRIVPQAKVETHSSVLFVGKYDRKMPYGSKSKIIGSPLADMIRPRMKAPAMLERTLVAGQYVDPMAKALQSYDVPIHQYDDNIMFSAMSSCFANLVNAAVFNEERKRKPLTLREAICGIEGNPYYSGMNWQTSAGLPWCMENHPGFKGKEWWFGKDGVLNDKTM